jgi:hypothetical protein
VDKDRHPCSALLVDDEHARAEPVRRGLDTALGVQIPRSAPYEILVCGGKLSGGERFAGAGLNEDAHGAPSSWASRSAFGRGRRGGVRGFEGGSQGADPPRHACQDPVDPLHRGARPDASEGAGVMGRLPFRWALERKPTTTPIRR